MSNDTFATAIAACARVLGLCAGFALASASAAPLSTVYVSSKSVEARTAADALMAQARAKGKIRVIVGLAGQMRSEASLAPGEVANQRAALKARQDGVAARTLGAAEAGGVTRFSHIPYMSLFVTPDQLQRLLKDPDVVSVKRDKPSRPLLKDSVKTIHAKELWAESIDGSGRTVAVLDTGAELKHPMLKDRIVSQACYSTIDAAETSSSLCPNLLAEEVGGNSGDNCPELFNGCDHGTHVSSIAMGRSGKLDGVARGASLISLQVFSLLTDCDGGPSPCVRSFETDQIKALERVFALKDGFKIDAVNMSLGGGSNAVACDADHAALKAAIDNLRAAGIATVIASGNDGVTGQINSPACISSAIAVGNVNDADLVAPSSNHSPLVKLLAPGTKIEAAVPGKAYATLSGTSMAAPHVAGAFALMRQTEPKASIDNIVAALACSGKTVHERATAGAPVGVSPQLPRIDVLGAHDWLKRKGTDSRKWTFSSGSEAKDWSPILGKWEITTGIYRPNPFPVGWSASMVPNCSSNFTAESAMTRLGSSANFFPNAGLMFKAKVSQSTKVVSGYWAAFNTCPTSPEGICDPENKKKFKRGQAVFWKMTNTDLDGAALGFELKCAKRGNVNVSGENVVKVVSNGSNHQFFLNGSLVCTVNDATYATGIVAPATFTQTAAGHSFKLNNLKLQSTDQGPVPALASISAEAETPMEIPAGMTPAGSGSALTQ